MGFFQAGGDLRVGAFYAERAADDMLYRVLSAGGLAFVLAPRQIGKSSLGRRVARRLKAEGWVIAHVDMNLVGAQSTDQDRWAFGLAAEIAGQLGWTLDDIEAWWDRRGRLGAIQRVSRLIRELSAEHRLALFLDEIDGVLSLPFDPDDFFTALRALHNDDTSRCLSMCLLGVATPGELVRDETRTPFNVGTAIRLEDLTREELAPLGEGVEDWGDDPDAWLDAVYRWTNGHPYMSQRVLGLLEELYEDALDDDEEDDWPPEPPAAMVDAAVDQAFLQDGRTAEANLIYAEQRLEAAPSTRRIRMVRIYRRLLRDERVPADVSDPDQQELLLSGMVARARDADGEVLRVRNRVFATVFDEAWVAGKETLGELFVAMRRWADGGRLAGDLLSGTALAEALAWFQDNTEVLDAEAYAFLEASQAEAKAAQEQRAALAELVAAKARLDAEMQAEERALAEQLREEADKRARLAGKLQWEAEARALAEKRAARQSKRLTAALAVLFLGALTATAVVIVALVNAFSANADLTATQVALEGKNHELEEATARVLENNAEIEMARARLEVANNKLKEAKDDLESRNEALEEAKRGLEERTAALAESERSLQAKTRELEQQTDELATANMIKESALEAQSDALQRAHHATAAKFAVEAISKALEGRAWAAIADANEALDFQQDYRVQRPGDGSLIDEMIPEVYAATVHALSVAERVCPPPGDQESWLDGMVKAPTAPAVASRLTTPRPGVVAVDGRAEWTFDVGGGNAVLALDTGRLGVVVWFSGDLTVVDFGQESDAVPRPTTVRVVEGAVAAAAWRPGAWQVCVTAYGTADASAARCLDLAPDTLAARVRSFQADDDVFVCPGVR